MNKRKMPGWILSAIFILSLLNSTHAQSLPKGKYHRNRERVIDIIHYKAELNFDFSKKEVAGKATVIFCPLNKINKFSLDAMRLKFDTVDLIQETVANPLKFEHHDQALEITLDRIYSPRDTVTVSIRYLAQPNAGMYFSKDYEKDVQFYIYTYGEGGLHANWLPIYNDVNDKFSTEMVVTVPPPYTVISNGKLINVEKLENGSQTFHWKQDLPHPNYLISIYVGEFEKGDLPPAFGTIPLSYWVPKGRLKEGAYVFRNTTRMVEFFSNRFNYKYPWDKYDQIAFPDYAIGAMEHTSITGHRASMLRDEHAPSNFGPPDFESYHNVWTAEGVIAHELAHHWFGNNLTCRNLNYLWLNESFATYCQMLWDEEFMGKETLLLDRQDAIDRYMNYVAEEHLIRPLEYSYYDTVGEIYTIELTYFKGAIILHMLRNILGDEDFFRTWSYYLHKHEFSNVKSQDFKIAIEEATGKNLDWFFDDWIYGGGYPIFEVSYTYLKDCKLIDLTVKQVQAIIKGQDLFTLPVEIIIATSKGVKRETIWVKTKEDQFLLGCDEEPLMVSFDGKGALVAEIRFNKSLDELLYEIENGELPGRIWAMREIANRFPVHPKSLQAISNTISGAAFWGLKAEAALLLGKLRTPEAEKVISKALKSFNYRIRKAAVLALPNFRIHFAEKILKNIIKKDPHSDVVATAIVALARTNPDGQTDFIRKQINRSSWYDEIKIACLKAFEIIGNERLVSYIRTFTDEKYHEFTRIGALEAWKSCRPDDRELHEILMNNAKDTQAGVQLFSTESLGLLYVAEAVPLLEKIVDTSGDIDFRVAAKKALVEIKRVADASK
ncbi:MAG: M1 family metallopeptidase [Bacteroidales bacterium]|nr:M1 family metallopeptidase [Bacteroidales bacterium]